MSPGPSFAELRNRAGFQPRARPLVRSRPAARTVVVVAALLAFFALCVAVAFWGGFDLEEDGTEAPTELRGFTWMPALHTAALVLGALLFGFPARRTWRLGAALVGLAFLAPPVALLVAFARATPDPERAVNTIVGFALLSALPVTGLVALAVETRRRLRWDRFR